jgi:Tfp pilus assembly protein PilF
MGGGVMQCLKQALLGGALAAVAATAALAAGTGGGGMGGAPSASAPAYDPAVEYAKGVEALRAKDYKAAVRALKRVTDAAPKSADAWRLLGVAQAGQDDWKGSRKAYERAVRLDADDMMSHAGLGLALANLKDPKAQGELDWLKAKGAACAETCPEAATLKSLTAAVESALAGPAEAPKPGAALAPGSLLFASPQAGDAAYVRAVSLINERRYDEALATLKAAERAFGPHPDILTYAGYAWRKKGDAATAERYYRQALAIAPGHRGATEYYGELKVEQGDIAGARLMLARLDAACAYGCAEADELRRWIEAGRDPRR